MNTLENVFNGQPNAKTANPQLNQQQQNIVMQLMTMGEEQRAQIIVDALNRQGITTKEQLENLIKNTRRGFRL